MMRRLTMFDPTAPDRWPTQQAAGREAFQLRHGIVIGTLIAVLYDVALLLVRHDLALFFSIHHASQLLLICLSVGPIAGLIAGRMLWRLGEHRYGDALLTREFLGKPMEPKAAEPKFGHVRVSSYPDH